MIMVRVKVMKIVKSFIHMVMIIVIGMVMVMYKSL